MTASRLAKLRACLDRRQPDLTVITDNVHKPHNVSAIMRTCDAAGVFSMHAAMRANEQFRARSGIAMGSDKWLDVHVHEDVTVPIKALRENNVTIVAVHKSPRSREFREIDYTRPVGVLFGAEMFGVSDVAADLADEHVVIPMMGMVESYNVSVAAAIVLLEAQRQRHMAGYYGQVRLDAETYQKTLYRWYRASEAAFCDRYSLDYPAIGEDGELLDPASFERIRAQI